MQKLLSSELKDLLEDNGVLNQRRLVEIFEKKAGLNKLQVGTSSEPGERRYKQWVQYLNGTHPPDSRRDALRECVGIPPATKGGTQARNKKIEKVAGMAKDLFLQGNEVAHRKDLLSVDDQGALVVHVTPQIPDQEFQFLHCITTTTFSNVVVERTGASVNDVTKLP